MFLGSHYLVLCWYIYIFVMFVMKCWHFYYIFCSNVFQQSKLQKIRSIIIIDTIISNKKQSQPSKKPPRSFQFVHSISLFLLYIPFLPSFYPFHPFIGFHDATGMVTDRWVDSILRYARQLTTFYVLVRLCALESHYT